MIDAVRGRVVGCEDGRVVVEVGGVALGIVVGPASSLARAGMGDELRIPTYLHVRDDALELFGFESEAHRALFRTLLAISGIGPRLALSIVSAIDPLAFARAVATADRAALQRAPGVGRKLAERMLLELRDRFDRAPAISSAAGSAAAGPWDDAATALITLGYDRGRVATSLARLRAELEDSPATDEIVRAALQGLRGSP